MSGNVFPFNGGAGGSRDNGGNSGHTGSGNPPGGGDLENRILNLERDMGDLKVAVAKVETRLESIEKYMLTKGQAAIYALATVVTVFGAGWWIVQQYLAPILAKVATGS